MAESKSTLPVTLLLVVLFLIGFLLNVAIIVDLEWTQRWLRPIHGAVDRLGMVDDEPLRPRSSAATGGELAALRRGIFLVLVPDCSGDGASSGTAFGLDERHLATAAHVVENAESCGAEVRVVDHEGEVWPAELDGMQPENDLAILSTSSAAVEPLTLADSSNYEEINDAVKVVTIGYPLVGTASEADQASLSGEGNISSYDRRAKRFVTSGLNVNPGNSGGPVFLRDNWTVLGVASAKLDPSLGEGIGWVVPINLVRYFFEERIGRSLP